ncbi:MAG: acyl-CoA/acyl-ACP dehydrogenase [Candidatus Thermoplasmatota archaeon]|jgi:acyl-CoA dehydrogenase|nr:acyl-CoA/acyl-ACP dehydrogenase [Candidatus Thermoplasmatota archaeon]
MDFNFTEEQDIIRSSARQFAQKEIAPRIQEMVAKRRIPQEIISGMKKLGVLGMTVPEKYGGMGADAVTTGIVAEEIAAADPTMSIPVMFLVHNAWSYLVSKYSGSEVAQEFLPKMAKGEIITAIASTEPNFGSDIGSMTTTATRSGSDYIINGEKSFISLVRDVRDMGGGYVTVAKTAPDKGTSGVTLFYTPDSKDHIEITNLEEMGREGSTWGALNFRDYRINEKFILGKVNQGFKIVHEGFEFARSLIAVMSVSTAMTCLNNGIEYMKTRKAFGQPIGKYQGLQFQLADHMARMEAARTLGFKALWMYDQEQKYKKFTRFEVSREVATAKLLATIWSFDAINDALQWHGAYGYTKYNPQELALRGVRSFMLAEGSREIMKMIIARESLGKEFFKE